MGLGRDGAALLLLNGGGLGGGSALGWEGLRVGVWDDLRVAELSGME